MQNLSDFKQKPMEERLEIYSRIKKMHPQRTPILMYRSERSELQELKNEK
jgi:hypothetical protein